MLVNEKIVRDYLDANCGSYKENDKEFFLLSPFFDRDNQGKLYISKANGQWIDFLAAGDKKYQGRFDKLVSLMEKIPIGHARKKIVDIYIRLGIDIDSNPDVSDTIRPNIDKLPVALPDSFMPALKHPISAHYLKTRGVLPTVTEMYRIMYNRSAGTVVLPYLNDNNVVYYIERFIDKSNLQRWKFPSSSEDVYYSKADLFFGEHTVTSVDDIVFITEGPFDSIRISQFGFQSMAICGASISARQIEFLKMNNFRRIGLALDFDDAGQKATHGIAEALTASTSTTVMFNHSQEIRRKILDSGKKDWGELTEDTFMEFVQGLVPYYALARVSGVINEL